MVCFFCFSYVIGRIIGVVLDFGDGVIYVVFIYEGFVMFYLIMRIDIVGRDVFRFFRFYLRKEGYDFYLFFEFEIVKVIKEVSVVLWVQGWDGEWEQSSQDVYDLE